MLTFSVISPINQDDRIAGTIDNEKFNIPSSLSIKESLVTLQEEFENIEEIEAYELWVKKVKDMISSVSEGDIITSECSDLILDQKTGNYYIKVEDKISKHAVPSKLVDVILESVEKDIDPTPIIKAWIRFLRNPNFNSKKAERFASYITASIIDGEELDSLMEKEGYTYEKALERATYNDVTISQEGLIVTKKYAKLLTKGWVIDPETNEAVLESLFKTTKTVDTFSGKITETTEFPEFVEELTFEPPIMGRSGDAFFCGDNKGHEIRVGQVIELKSWSQVNCDDNVFGRPGLHSGGYQYVANYKASNNQLLNCFVDPADIGAIIDINTGDGAIRSLRYFVYGVVEGRTKGIYHSSKYAAMRDEAWEDYKKEAIEASNKVQAAISDFDVA